MRKLPNICQFGFVVNDLDVAIEHWTTTLEVGPFFVLEHVPYEHCVFRDQKSPIDMSVAMAYSGNMQIELVCQHNESPSIFTEHLASHGEGLQHVGVLVEDLDDTLAFFETKSAAPIQHGVAENGTRFAYLNTDLYPGTMLELFQVPDRVASAFEYMQRAAEDWDPIIGPARR